MADDPDDARDIQRIPLVEIANAILDTLRNSGSVPTGDAVSAVAHTLDFNCYGTNVRDIISQALKHCTDTGLIEMNNRRYTLPERGRGTPASNFILSLNFIARTFFI